MIHPLTASYIVNLAQEAPFSSGTVASSPIDWTAVALTARLASISSVVLLAIALPLAYWLVFSRVRWRFLVQAVFALPIVLPPTVLGFYLLVLLGNRSPLGRGFERITGGSFAFSFSGLVFASVLYSIPFALQPLLASFSAIDPKLLAASDLLGAGRWRALRRIVLPLSMTGVVSSCVLGFAHVVGEFGVVLMVGGNIPGVTRTLSIDVYDRVQQFDFAGAQRTSLLLLAFSFCVLAFVYGMQSADSRAAGVGPLAR